MERTRRYSRISSTVRFLHLMEAALRMVRMKSPLRRSLCGEKIGALAPALRQPLFTQCSRALVEVLIHRLFDAPRQALGAECPRKARLFRRPPAEPHHTTHGGPLANFR